MTRQFTLLMQVKIDPDASDEFVALMLGDTEEERAESVERAVRDAMHSLRRMTNAPIHISRQPEVQQ